MQNIRSKSSNGEAKRSVARSSPPRPAVRPVRRRSEQRRLVLLAVVVSMGASFLWAPRLVAAATHEPAIVTHVVAPGETLWGVAHLHVSEETDPRAFIDQVREMNGLSTVRLSPGQQLRLPPQH